MMGGELDQHRAEGLLNRNCDENALWSASSAPAEEDPHVLKGRDGMTPWSSQVLLGFQPV